MDLRRLNSNGRKTSNFEWVVAHGPVADKFVLVFTFFVAFVFRTMLSDPTIDFYQFLALLAPTPYRGRNFEDKISFTGGILI